MESKDTWFANKYPEIYRIVTIMKVVQGIGRSVRNSEDYCTTFILDKNAEQLFNSRLNVWKNEFAIS